MTRPSKIIIAVLLAIAVALIAIGLTSPDSSGGSSSVTYNVPPEGKLIMVSQTTWNRKGRVRHIRHHINRTNLRTRALNVGPCYRVDAEVHGDSKVIDKVVQGFGHFKLCMRAGDHTKVNDRYSGASSSHRETWMWGFDHVEFVKGAGISTSWCNDGVGPCRPVEYRYWRYTFFWKQGVSVFGQDIAHHKTLYIGCTLRAGAGGFQCGTGDVS